MAVTVRAGAINVDRAGVGYVLVAMSPVGGGTASVPFNITP